MKDKERKIYLIDGHALCYRAYYAIPELSTSRGMPTNAVYGFMNILRRLIKTHGPCRMVMVFDTPAPTARHKKYEDYKIHRKPMPSDLIVQIPKIKEIVSAFRIPICQLDGYEADDLIATLSKRALGLDMEVVIVTGDKDALQLVNDRIKVLSPHASSDEVYDISFVKAKYGIEPKDMVDFMAFAGDASDNIPGVKGIGPLTASKLISLYGSFQKVYENIDNITSESTKKKLLEGKETAELSRDLALLDENVPIELDFDETFLKEPDFERLAELCGELEFGKMLREIIPKQDIAGNYRAAETEKEITLLQKDVEKNKIVSFSIAGNFSENAQSGIAFSWEEGEGCFMPVDFFGRSLLQSSLSGLVLAKNIFENENIEKIGYDIKQSLFFLRQYGIDINGGVFDVMLADYLIDPGRAKYSLSDIALREINYNLPDKKDKKTRDDTEARHSSGFLSKNFSAECEQSDVILRLYKKFCPVLHEKELMPLFRDVEMPLVNILARMESTGVGIDLIYLEEKRKETEKNLKKLTDKIYELTGESFNINSPKQLQVVLYDKFQLPVTKKTKTGASTDESVLRNLAQYHELPKILLEYREINKLKTAYYDSITELTDKKTSILHARFNQAVTATGRLSSSEPNLQNIPIKTELGRQIRRVFVPPAKDSMLLAADYSQIELRILAHLSKDEKLVTAFKQGEDVHRFTASLIFDSELKDVTDEMRVAAKTVNFGIVYGMSAFGLAKDLGIKIEEAQKFIDAYFTRYNGVKMFIEKTIAQAEKTGFVTTLLKRRRYIPEINSSENRLKDFAERIAVNTPVQGSAADLIKLAMIALYKEFKNTQVHMLIQVHDELVFSVPNPDLKSVSGKVKEIMEHVIHMDVPLKVDIEAGKNWLEMEPLTF